MVAIVAGNGLGLFNASNNILGSLGMVGQGTFGQAGGRSYVNAATGSLVLQFQDELLSGRGADFADIRTYNSLGQLDDAGGTGWHLNGERTVQFSGTTAQKNVSGTVTRTSGDGHVTTYTWDGSRYVSTEGSGAYDSINYDATNKQWVWTDGSSRLEERYGDSTQGSLGYLASQKDTSGNLITYNFDQTTHLLNSIVDASGQKMVFTYGPAVPGSSKIRLQRVDTYELTKDSSGNLTTTVGSPLTAVTYGYDSTGRLTSVTTDLTPNNATDNTDPTKIYVTSYTYDGTSSRIASISQSDGTSVGFTYTSDGTNRIATVSEGGVLTQSIAYVGNRTDVTDANNKVWSYTYDPTTQQLTQIDTPAPTAGAARLTTRFTYDPAGTGNLFSVTDARNNTINYRYDGQGNRTLEYDALGNTVTRTFDDKNQVLTETHYTATDSNVSDSQLPAGALTTRYVYDSSSRLRFVVSGEGRVTEYRYGTGISAFGLMTQSVQYASGRYDVTSLTPTSTLTETQLVAWVAQSTLDKRQEELTTYEYDLRGNLSKRTDFATTDASGAGVTDSATKITQYIYDGHGELLQDIAWHGSDHPILSSYVYDGLGRQTQIVNSNGTQNIVYSGTARTITITNVDTGLIATRTFDTRGRLTSVSVSDGSTTRNTQYVYDAVGRLLMVQDALGNRHFSFYDAAGRLQFQVDSTGAVTGYTYNADGQITSSVNYATAVSATARAGWVTGTGANLSVTKATLVPGTDITLDATHDRTTSYDYDAAGRLTNRTDAGNLVTITSYDGDSRVTGQQVGNRVTQYFYDADGNLVGTIDPLGYLAEKKYDAAGRLVQTINYSTRVSSSADISAPVWLGISNQTAVGGKVFSYRMPATDADGDALTFQFVGTPPGWLSLDTSVTGGVTLVGTPPKTLTTYSVTVRASDGRGMSQDVTVQITVGNTAPAWKDLQDNVVAVNAQNYSLTLPAATDNESAAGQLVYSIDPTQLPPGLTFNASTRTISGVPTTPGSFTITARVADASGGAGALYTEKSFVITVSNAGPTWDAVPQQNALSNINYFLQLPRAVDPEGEALTYSVVSTLPSWLSFDPNGLTLSGLTPNTVQDPVTIVLQAQDPHGAVVQLSFSLQVTGNHVPVWNTAVAAITVPAGVEQDQPLSSLASDPDGDTLIYTAGGLPPGLRIDPATGHIKGTTVAVGTYFINIFATDPQGAFTYQHTIPLTVLNAPPVYHGGLHDETYQSGDEDFAQINLPSQTFTDGNGDPLTYTVSMDGGPSWLTVSSGSGGVSLSGSVPFQGFGSFRTYTFTVIASDGRGATASGSFVVTVLGQENPPPGPPGDPPHQPFLIGGGDLGSPTSPMTPAPAPVLVAAPAANAIPPAPPPPVSSLTPNVDVLAALRPTATSNDLHTYDYYDGTGRMVGAVDSRGFLTETVYDETGNGQQTVHYMSYVTVGADDNLDSLKRQAVQAANDAGITVSETTTIEYDDFGRVAQQTSADQTVTQYEYDSAGRVTRVIQAEGTSDQRATRTQYDAYGEVTGTLSGAGDQWLANNPTAALTDALKLYGVRYVYDSGGRRTKEIYADGTDALGNTTLDFYDSEGRLTQRVNAMGEVSETLYDTFGDAKSSRQYSTRATAAQMAPFSGGDDAAFQTFLNAQLANAATDRLTSYEYDQRGLVTKATDALGYVTSNTYTTFGELDTQIRTIIKDSGTTTTTQFKYDRDGRLLSQSSDVGGINFTTQRTYDAFGRIVSSIDGAGKAATTSYLDSGRKIQVTDALNHSTTTTYDAFGRTFDVTDANGQTTSYRYDDVNERSVIVTTPENISVKTIYTRNGQALKVTDGRQNTTTYEYNADGQLTKVTDTLNHIVNQIAYDGAGRVSQTTDARGIVTVLTYDAANRVLTRHVDPSDPSKNYKGLDLATTYEFDAFGQQTTVTRGTGNNTGANALRKTAYHYDLDGRLAQVVVDPAGLALATTYKYDGLGDTIQVSQGTFANPDQQVTLYVFDKLGRRIREIVAPSTTPGAATSRTRDLTIEYRYDAAGRISRKIDADGQSTWYVYDAVGQLTDTINALGEVSETLYDADGRVAQTRRYATRVDTSTFGNVVRSVTTTPKNTDQRIYFVYDKDGRQVYTVQAQVGTSWSITQNIYDANGNVIERRGYDKLFGDTESPADDTLPSPIDTTQPSISVDQVKAELTALGYDETDAKLSTIQRTHFTYDADNRLRFTVDALGDVSEQIYDNAGNVVKSIRYAGVPTLPVDSSGKPIYSEDKINSVVDRTNGGNQVTAFAYDAADRLRYTVKVLAGDAQGNATKQLVSERTYDALGQLVESTQYASQFGSIADYSEGTIAGAVTGTSQDRRQAFVFDAAGRQVYALQATALDAHGTPTSSLITRQTYDAMGHVLTTTAYAKSVTTLTDYTHLTQSAVSGVLIDPSFANNAQNRTSLFTYDLAGRQRFAMAANGAFTENVYDSLGRVIEQRQFAVAVDPKSVTGAADPQSVLAAARGNHAVGDGVTRGTKFVYDAAGRVVAATDANGYTEKSVYNGVGDRTSFVDKNGSTWTYDYDRLGRLYTLTPPASLMQLTGQAGLVSFSPRTRYYYDAFGNLVKKAEVAGSTPDTRVTGYAYDRLGRLVTVGLSGYYDPSTGRVNSAPVAGSFVRTIDYSYDALGNKTRTKTRIGPNTFQYEYKSFDLLGRETYDVDALNNVTGFTYTPFGEQQTVTRYSKNVGAPSGGATAMWTDSALTSALAGDALARTITTTYDNLGRKTDVTQPTVSDLYYTNSTASVLSAGTVSPTTAAATTHYDYDVFGDVIHEASSIDTRKQDTWHYYDTMGRETVTVDALGYMTARTYDALGNVTETIQYANQLNVALGSATLPAPPTISANDRITDFTYDARNQQIKIQRKNLRYASGDAVNGYGVVDNGRDFPTTISMTQYDGLGHVVQQSDALGNVTNTEYNAIGQVTRVSEPPRWIASGSGLDPFLGGGETFVQPVTTYTYNAYGQVVSQTHSPGINSDGTPVAGPTTITTQRGYDYAGNLISTTDANGNVTNMQVDYAGRVIKQTLAISVTLGSWQTVQHTIETRFAYDATGRQTDVLQVYLDGSTLMQSGRRSVYNAFGEVIEQRQVWGTANTPSSSLNRPLVATFTYDNAGRVATKTTAAGVCTYFYDLAGQVTRQEERGIHLSGNSNSSDNSAVRVTENGYDLLGRQIYQRLPTVNTGDTLPSTTPVTPYTEATYDRWGNVLTRSQGGYVYNASGAVETSARATISYDYNADNQVIAEHLPTTVVRTANATSYLANVTHQTRYDALGRDVEEIDVVDDASTAAVESTILRTRTKGYDSAGHETSETDGTGITTQYAYDVNGNRVGTRNAIGTVFVDGFDRNGNLISHSVLRSAADGGAYTSSATTTQTPILFTLNTYQYDQANRRYASSDLLHDSGNAIYTVYTQYDERGLIRAQRTPDIQLVNGQGPVDFGIVTTSSYDVLGNKVQQRDQNGNGQNWNYDTTDDYKVGQLVSTTAGTRTTSYQYNDFGQDSVETYTGGGIVAGSLNQRIYTHYSNGQLAEIDDNSTVGTAGPVGGDDYWSTSDTTKYSYTSLGQVLETAFTRTSQYDNATYDSDGNVVSVSDTPANGATVSSTTETTYDVLGRLVSVSTPGQGSGRATLNFLDYRYDELGNVREIQTSYNNGGAGTSDRYYTYDAEGRMLLVDAVFDSSKGKLVADSNTTRLTYDGLGRRLTAEKFLIRKNYTLSHPPGEPAETQGWDVYRQEQYSYNDLNYLTTVSQRLNWRDGLDFMGSGPGFSAGPDVEGSYVNSSTRIYDTRGEMTSNTVYADLNNNSNVRFQAGGGQKTAIISTTYRADGQMFNQISVDQTGDATKNTFVKDNYDSAGVLQSYIYDQGIGQSLIFETTYTYSYDNEFGGYKERSITARTTQPAGAQGPAPQNATTYNYYDSSGNLTHQVISNGHEIREREFSYNTDGQVMTKDESVRTGNTDPGTRGTQDYFYANGTQVAVLGTGTLAIAQFNNSYTPISDAYPPSSPGAYVVNAGDTLASIAQTVFGDAQLWYLIADANSLGFQPNDPLPVTEVGKSYRIPDVVGNVHHNADTYTPYDPSGIIGNSTPSPYLPPPPTPSCGDKIAGALIVVVAAAAAAVVTAYTGGALGPMLSQVLGAVAGNLVSQGLSYEAGLQDGFSAKQLLAAGATSALNGFAELSTAGAGISNGYFDIAQHGFLDFVGNGLAGTNPNGSDALWDIGTQLAVHGAFDAGRLGYDGSTGQQSVFTPWDKAYEQVAGGAVNPNSGWVFNDRSRDWANIAGQAAGAFTSVGVGVAFAPSTQFVPAPTPEGDEPVIFQLSSSTLADGYSWKGGQSQQQYLLPPGDGAGAGAGNLDPASEAQLQYGFQLPIEDLSGSSAVPDAPTSTGGYLGATPIANGMVIHRWETSNGTVEGTYNRAGQGGLNPNVPVGNWRYTLAGDIYPYAEVNPGTGEVSTPDTPLEPGTDLQINVDVHLSQADKDRMASDIYHQQVQEAKQKLADIYNAKHEPDPNMLMISPDGVPSPPDPWVPLDPNDYTLDELVDKVKYDGKIKVLAQWKERLQQEKVDNAKNADTSTLYGKAVWVVNALDYIGESFIPDTPEGVAGVVLPMVPKGLSALGVLPEASEAAALASAVPPEVPVIPEVPAAVPGAPAPVIAGEVAAALPGEATPAAVAAETTANARPQLLLGPGRPIPPEVNVLESSGQTIEMGPGFIDGSPTPGPGETLVGSSESQMKRAALRIINGTEDHPLEFLVDENGNFKPQKGLDHSELIDRPDIVQMGHITSNKLGEPGRVMLQGAWENQLNNLTIERSSIGGGVLSQPAIDIGGIAVDLKTATFWEQIGWLDPGTVANAKIVR